MFRVFIVNREEEKATLREIWCSNPVFSVLEQKFSVFPLVHDENEAKYFLHSSHVLMVYYFVRINLVHEWQLAFGCKMLD